MRKRTMHNAENTETQIIQVETAMAKVEQIPTYFEATGSLDERCRNRMLRRRSAERSWR